MKNWQLRWFVLRAEALCFYKDQDETKAQVRQTEIEFHCMRTGQLLVWFFLIWGC